MLSEIEKARTLRLTPMQIFSSVDGLSADIGHKLKAMDQSANVIKERVRGMNFVAS